MTQASALPDSATEMSPPIVALHGVKRRRPADNPAKNAAKGSP